MKRFPRWPQIFSVFLWIFLCWRVCSAVGQDSLDRDYSDQLQRFAPRTAAAALQSLEISGDLLIELLASEPQVMDPVAICFDPWGRAYVAEMRGYSLRAEERLGRIKLLEDTSRDGRFDKVSVFADGLKWPSAIIWAQGGILVGDAPDILFLKDTSGDGQSDVRHVLFTGFGTTNLQQLPNSFQWGLDLHFYGASGGNGGQLRRLPNSEVPGLALAEIRGESSIHLAGRDFKINPRTLELQAIAGGTQFGMTFDQWGRRLVCSNSNHCQQIVFEERYAARNPHQRISSSRVNIAAEGPAAEVFRISPVEPWRRVRTRLRVQGLASGPIEGGGRAAGYFTSATGITCYDGDLLPPMYYGNVFVGDVGSNLVHRKQLVGDQIQLQARRTEPGTEFLRSNDTWFRPVQMANAPDGSLIVLDMYRETIEHPHSLPAIIKRHLDLNNGYQRGRIYRVLPKNKKIIQRLMPGKATEEQLVKMLEHPNGWHRRMAGQLLFDRLENSPQVPHLTRLLIQHGLKSKHPQARIRSMYLLGAFDKLSSMQMDELLGDPHPQVRIHALRMAEAMLDPELESRIITLAADPDIAVRFQTALTLGQLNRDISDAITKLAESDGGDPWMHTALSSSAFRQRGPIMRRLVDRISGDSPDAVGCRKLFLELAGQLARSATQQEVDAAIQILSGWPPDASLGLLGQFLTQVRRLPAPQLQELRVALEQAGGSLDQMVGRVVAQARGDAANADLAVPQRVTAIHLLRLDPTHDITGILDDLLQLHQPPQVKMAAVNLASQYQRAEIGRMLLRHLRGFTPDLRRTALQVILSRENWVEMLLDEVGLQTISPAWIDATFKQQLVGHPKRDIAATAKSRLGIASHSNRASVIQEYLTRLPALKADVNRGRLLFRQHCVNCHRLENQGMEVGPNLAAFANRGAEAMVVNILDPNREVDPQFLSYQVQLKDGRLLLGAIDNETATTIGLRNAQGELRVILRNEIELMQSTSMSLMPENLESEISVQDMAHLIAFLLSQAG